MIRGDSMEQQVNAQRRIFTVDSFEYGVAFGQHHPWEGSDPRGIFGLHLEDRGSMIAMRSRYALDKNNRLSAFERHLSRLERQGVLSESTVLFGVVTDPFFPFEGKFDASMKFLELFTRYTPKALIVQTRSPLSVIAMPVFKSLGDRALVNVYLETTDDEVRKACTPHLPRCEERISLARTLHRFGVPVGIQIHPLFPTIGVEGKYGEMVALFQEISSYVKVSSWDEYTHGSSAMRARTRVAAVIEERFGAAWLSSTPKKELMDAIATHAPTLLATPRMLPSSSLERVVAA
jgi:hypothetical protein